MRSAHARALASRVAWTLPWVVFAALVDAFLLERWYGVAARKPLHYPELALNAVGVALLFAVVIASFSLLAERTRRARHVSWDVIGAGSALGIVAVAFLLRHPVRGGGEWMTFAPGLLVLVAGGALVLIARNRSAAAAARVLLALLLLLALAGEALRGPLAHVRARGGGGANGPNVVLIVIDTLRADHLSCHGFPRETSPEIDALAERGVRFSHAIAQASWTLPATASIHTGRFPSSHGAVSRGLALPEGALTLAEVLAENGYRCGAFSENQIVSSRYGFDQGFEWFWSYWLPWISTRTLAQEIRSRLGIPAVELLAAREYPRAPTAPAQLNWDARKTTDVAIRWLRSAASGGKPIFAYVHFMGPHGPYGPPEYLLDGDPPPSRIADHPRAMGGGYPLAEPGSQLSAESYADLRTLYAADIRYVDREVGRIVDELRVLGIDEETLVIVTSDHGEEFFEHGGWNHGGSVFQEIVHIPLIAAGALPVERGRTIETPVRQVDLMPTILESAGVETPDSHGRSLWPLAMRDGEAGDVRSDEDAGSDAVFIEGCFVRPEGIDGVAVIQNGRKLIRVSSADSAATLFYDLRLDPAEREELKDGETALIDSLRSELIRWGQVARLYHPERRDVRLDPETIRALRRLGYLQ